MGTLTLAIILTVVALASVAVAVALYFRHRETDPAALALRQEVRDKNSALKSATSIRNGEISSARKELKRAEKDRSRRIKAAQQHLSDLQDTKGKLIASYHGVRLHERWITTPHGSGSLVGVHASVDSQVSSRITATRLLAIGIFALAAKKKTGALYLSVDGPDFASVIECPQDDQMKSREFATKIANAAKSAARQAEERPRLINAAKTALTSAQDTGEVDRKRERLTRVEADPELMAAVSTAQSVLDEVLGRQKAHLSARSVAAAENSAVPPTTTVSLAKLPLE